MADEAYSLCVKPHDAYAFAEFAERFNVRCGLVL